MNTALADESWSDYTLTFSGDMCTKSLLGYGKEEYGRGLAPDYTGSSSNMTGTMMAVAAS